MAKRLGDIKRQYQKATALKSQEQWEEAARELKAFNDLCLRLSNSIPDPDLRRACQDAAGELPGIERKAQLTSLYMEGKTLYDKQEWARAAEAFQKLQATDSEYKKDEVTGYLYVTYLSDHGERVIEVAGNAADRLSLPLTFSNVQPRLGRAILVRLMTSIWQRLFCRRSTLFTPPTGRWCARRQKASIRRVQKLCRRPRRRAALHGLPAAGGCRL